LVQDQSYMGVQQQEKERQEDNFGTQPPTSSPPPLDPNDDICSFCKVGGELICCERCPSAWHPYCLFPQISELPTGMWICPFCDESKNSVRSILLGKKIKVKTDGSSKRKLKPPKRKPNEKDPWWDCLDLLKMLKIQKKVEPFKERVDPKKLNVPDYYETIVMPMELSTVERRLYIHMYTNMTQFANDIRLIWSNAETFNGPNNDITALAIKFRELFEQNFQQKEKAWREYYSTLPYTRRRLKSRPVLIRKFFKHFTIKKSHKRQKQVYVDTKSDEFTPVPQNSESLTPSKIIDITEEQSPSHPLGVNTKISDDQPNEPQDIQIQMSNSVLYNLGSLY